MFTRDYMGVHSPRGGDRNGAFHSIISRTAADLGSDRIYAQFGTNDVRPTLPL